MPEGHRCLAGVFFEKLREGRLVAEMQFFSYAGDGTLPISKPEFGFVEERFVDEGAGGLAG